VVSELPAIMTYEGPLWRIFRTRGRHRVAWNAYRDYGPQVTAMYAGTDALTPLAEVFGRPRMIDPSAQSGWRLAGWIPTRQLSLLDLATNGAILPSADIKRTDPWLQFTSDDLGAEIDGVRGRSRLGAESVIILFESAAGALPQVPEYDQPLASTPAVVAAAAIRLGYGIRNY
jgi:hypothetical protein